MNEAEELLINFGENRANAELLASTSVQAIQMPLCYFFMKMTSTDCINLIKYDLEEWSHINRPSEDRILLYYFITDYISCGLASPVYHTEFNNNLHSDKSKMKLLKEIITIWNVLFKYYTVTSLNVEFVKRLIVSLERQFVELLKSVSAAGNKHLFQFNTIVKNINYRIAVFEKTILNTQVLHTLSNNVELYASNKNGISDIENKVPKQVLSVQGLTNQNTKHILALDNKKPKLNLHDVDQQLSKKPKPISTDVHSVSNFFNKSDTIHILPPEQKLNAFQIMMLNAKKRKTKMK